jgi:hypothetical protein
MSEFKVPKVACLSARLACLQTTKVNLNVSPLYGGKLSEIYEEI